MQKPLQLNKLSEREWIEILSRIRDDAPHAAMLPSLPDEQTQRRFVGKAYKDAFEQGVYAFSSFVNGAERLGLDITPDTTLMDFGCGWGRISQIAFWKVRPANIISVDVQQDAIDICRSTGLQTHLAKVDMTPPTNFGNESFDFIVAYSVFSHLREDIHLQWLSEFRRLLRPGGVLAVTTRTDSIIRHARDLSLVPEVPEHASGLVNAFPDWQRALEQYKSGQFVYRAYPTNAQAGEGYGEACIPEQYAQAVWRRFFEEVHFHSPTPKVDQAIIIARK